MNDKELDDIDMVRIARLQDRLMNATADEILELAAFLYTYDVHTVDTLELILTGDYDD